jgi:hypothetical protein
VRRKAQAADSVYHAKSTLHTHQWLPLFRKHKKPDGKLMLSAPGYWLAPCLVALAAWINDESELADRAVREAIKRNDEKTSLLFALICRRADRKSASLKWTQRYLANQDEENLDHK